MDTDEHKSEIDRVYRENNRMRIYGGQPAWPWFS